LRPRAAASSPLSLHDALPIYTCASLRRARPALPTTSRPMREHAPLPAGQPTWFDPGWYRISAPWPPQAAADPAIVLLGDAPGARDRKSTRLNSSHVKISYAVF